MTAKRVDEHQASIVADLRSVGYKVFVTSHCGQGFPDLVCGDQNGRIVLLEVKTITGKKTPKQIDFHREWEEYPVYVVRSIREALEVLEHETQTGYKNCT